MIDKNMLGVVIKNARCEAHILATNLAEKIGVSDSHMSHIETGKCDVTIGKLNLISEALSVPVEVLLLRAVCPKKLHHMRALLMLEMSDSWGS